MVGDGFAAVKVFEGFGLISGLPAEIPIIHCRWNTATNPLTRGSTAPILITMIPAFINLPGAPWPVLPPGVHRATMNDIHSRFAHTFHRQLLFQGLSKALRSLLSVGCERLYLNGSYVTSKPRPEDYDACWDPAGVNEQALDPVFMTFNQGRMAQKARFGGEFFPSTTLAGTSGKNFLDFFQTDRHTLQPKGIILISLVNNPALQEGETS